MNQNQPRDEHGKWRPFVTDEGQLDFTTFPRNRSEGSLIYPPHCANTEELITFYLQEPVPEHVIGMARSLYRHIHDNCKEVNDYARAQMEQWVKDNPRPDQKNPLRYAGGRHAEELQAWNDTYDQAKEWYLLHYPDSPPDLPIYQARSLTKIALASNYAYKEFSKKEQTRFLDALVDFDGEVDTIRNKYDQYILGDLGTALGRYYQWQGSETKPEIREDLTLNPHINKIYASPGAYGSLRSEEEF